MWVLSEARAILWQDEALNITENEDTVFIFIGKHPPLEVKKNVNPHLSNKNKLLKSLILAKVNAAEVYDIIG